MRMVPEVGASIVAMQLSSVDLPEPDGPMIATNSPRCTVRLTPFRAFVVAFCAAVGLRDGRASRGQAMCCRGPSSGSLEMAWHVWTPSRSCCFRVAIIFAEMVDRSLDCHRLPLTLPYSLCKLGSRSFLDDAERSLREDNLDGRTLSFGLERTETERPIFSQRVRTR
jgi:hypothetical protein